jgi:hypothetical protein
VKEEDFKSALVNDLVDLMVQCIDELSSFKRLRDRESMTLKTKEVQLIHKVIELRRRETLSECH